MKRKLKNPNTPELWDKLLFEKNDELLSSAIYLEKNENVSNFLKRCDGKFLDIGFGMGNLEKRMSKESSNLEVYGIDISDKAVANARSNLKGKFSVASIFKLPYKTKFFNAVSILDVLEHLSEDECLVALNEVSRVIRRGGKLIVSVPLNEDIKLGAKNENAHMRVYSPQILEKELDSIGFRVLKKEFLYAFKDLYKLKSFLIRFFSGFRKPNLVIVYCVKE